MEIDRKLYNKIKLLLPPRVMPVCGCPKYHPLEIPQLRSGQSFLIVHLDIEHIFPVLVVLRYNIETGYNVSTTRDIYDFLGWYQLLPIPKTRRERDNYREWITLLSQEACAI